MKFWKKSKDTDDKRETVLQISAKEGGIQELYVKAQSPKEAEELMHKLKDMAKS
jgi:hypothetical protein